MSFLSRGCGGSLPTNVYVNDTVVKCVSPNINHTQMYTFLLYNRMFVCFMKLLFVVLCVFFLKLTDGLGEMRLM